MDPSITPLQVCGFLLAGYAVIGNDALQTLGTYLASNRERTPRIAQALYLCLVLCGVLLWGWSRGDGDPAWGRLASFELPERFSWLDLAPPIAVIALTRWGAPVSTSFLVLTAFRPSSLPALALTSLAGYVAGFLGGALVYGAVGWLLERRVGEQEDTTSQLSSGEVVLSPFWLGLQWAATGWLWGQWLVQDLANIYVYLPRRLDVSWMGASLLALCAGVCLLVGRGGGPIQRVLERKSNSHDPRSTSLIAALYGLILFGFSLWSPVPMSTTWVFLGLLGGRELGMLLRIGRRQPLKVACDLGNDLFKAGIGLTVSLSIVLLVGVLKGRLPVAG